MLGILFSIAVNAVFVAKPLILGILPSISFILALQSVFLTRSLVLGTLFSIPDLSLSYLVFKNKRGSINTVYLATNLSYTVFLTTSYFTTSLSLLKSTDGANVSISNLSISVFRLAKFVFSAKTCVTFLKSVFVA